jgi:hypothetical protein
LGLADSGARAPRSIDRANYDVAPDGRILLISNPGVDGRRTQVRLVLKFFEELGRAQ